MSKKFIAEWEEPFYFEDKIETVDESFFTTDIGYDEKEIEDINALKVHQRIDIGLGGHNVTRIA